METDEQGSSSQTPSATDDDGLATIRVKTLTDHQCFIRVDPNATISRFRELIEQEMGIPTTEQRIIFQGKVLDVEKSLAFYGITDGLTVHMVDRSPPTNLQSSSSSSTSSNSNSNRVRAQPRDEDPYRRIMPHFHNLSIEQTSTSRHPSARRRAVHINWKLFVAPTNISRDQLERRVRDMLRDLPFLTETDRNGFEVFWRSQSEMRIELPYMRSHCASPALERLILLESNLDQFAAFLDVFMETGGLITIVNNILELVQSGSLEDDLTQEQRNALYDQLTNIATRFESIHTVVPNNRLRLYERSRNSTEAELEQRFEAVVETERNPSFVLRHALDTEMMPVRRRLRREYQRFVQLEELFERVVEMQAVPMVRATDASFATRDYRYAALAIFINYMHRMQHSYAHMTHLLADLEIPFGNTRSPTRLLPQYDLNRFRLSFAHSGTFIISFTDPHDAQRESVPVSAIFQPPRLRSDVARCPRGEWPFLTFFPTGVFQENQLNEPEPTVIEARFEPMPDGTMRMIGSPTTTTTITARGIAEFTTHVTATVGNPIPAPQLRTMIANPSRPVETTAPPTDPEERVITPGAPISGRNQTEPNPNDPFLMVGPETELMESLPIALHPNELQNFVRNLASRVRSSVYLRMARTITQRLRSAIPAWDLRLDRAPVVVLRDMFQIVLQFVAMAAPNAREAQNYVIALLSNEDITVRVIIESLRAFFVHNEFPTHVGRLIYPEQVAATIRVNIDAEPDRDEDDDQPPHLVPHFFEDTNVADPSRIRANLIAFEMDDEDTHEERNIFNDYDGINHEMMRLATDISQPARGSIREIALRRREARERNERRASASEGPSSSTAAPAASSSSGASSSTTSSSTTTRPGRFVRHHSDRRNTTVGSLSETLGSFIDMIPLLRTQSMRQGGRDANLRERPAGMPMNHGENANGERVHRRTLSLDPFLTCTNRHNEIMQIERAQPSEINRITRESMNPIPDWNDFYRTLNIPSRDYETAADDEEYSYQVQRFASGEVVIENSEEGLDFIIRLIRTGMRSLFSHLVESDVIIALNNLDVNALSSTSPRANAYQSILESSVFPLPLPREATFGFGLRSRTEHDIEREDYVRDRAFRDRVRRNQTSIGSDSNASDIDRLRDELERTFERGSLDDLAAIASFVVQYHELGSRWEIPSCFIGHMLRSFRVDEHHFSWFEPGSSASLANYLSTQIANVQQYVQTRLLNGNTSPTSSEIREAAERAAGSIDLFTDVMSHWIDANVNNTATINDRTYSIPYLLNRLDVSTIHDLIRLVTNTTPERLDAERHTLGMRFMNIISRYLGVGVRILERRNVASGLEMLRFALPRYVARNITSSDSRNQYYSTAWRHILSRIGRIYPPGDPQSTSQFRVFLATLDSSPQSPRRSPTVSPSMTRTDSNSRMLERDGSAEGESSAKRRKQERNEDEDERMDEEDGPSGSNS
ncbi:unnamed protein product [Caenorhabditis bovis]|uniref:Ubiquitin-like domain-containing protein n=1 Tax=Caenorhabditis bovis TaxID=2654633 RepID=A0A8S1EQY3_9PELO|nr:unnamed protein product [Caenorhabditis bovis]